MNHFKRKGPARHGQPLPTTTIDADQFTAPWDFGLHEPLTAESRADIDLLIAAAERGFRLATRCTRCNQWLVAPSSVRAHLGPVCRAKVGGDR
ncbi:DUF6011 domain-containing protein [Mycobacterium lentiflavum]|uniref:DUF6011 domain-containing protein n=1 Tax=Mycobacterium lentiflavum TaxID=141349 RepID=UPI000A63EE52